MTTFNLQWVRDFVASKLSYDSSEPSQAFGGTTADPWKRIDEIINDVYTEIVNEATLEVDEAAFLTRYSFTWPSSTTTYELPRHIAFSRSIKMMDVTNDEIGDEIGVFPTYRLGGLFWHDSRTLHWGDTSGPDEDKNFEWEYLADAEVLSDPIQEPVLVPFRYRYLLGWRAAMLARIELDEDHTPVSWTRRAGKLFTDYILDLSQGRLKFTTPPRFTTPFSDVGVTV